MPLQRYKLADFTRGWFVGNFSPTALSTDEVEVAVKHYRAGESESEHFHKVATELTLIVSGRVRMGGEEIGPGEIVRIEPGQATDFMPLTDTTTVVVKVPCVRGDKYLSADSAPGRPLTPALSPVRLRPEASARQAGVEGDGTGQT